MAHSQQIHPVLTLEPTSSPQPPGHREAAAFLLQQLGRKSPALPQPGVLGAWDIEAALGQSPQHRSCGRRRSICGGSGGAVQSLLLRLSVHLSPPPSPGWSRGSKRRGHPFLETRNKARVSKVMDPQSRAGPADRRASSGARLAGVWAACSDLKVRSPRAEVLTTTLGLLPQLPELESPQLGSPTLCLCPKAGFRFQTQGGVEPREGYRGAGKTGAHIVQISAWCLFWRDGNVAPLQVSWRAWRTSLESKEPGTSGRKGPEGRHPGRWNRNRQTDPGSSNQGVRMIPLREVGPPLSRPTEGAVRSKLWLTWGRGPLSLSREGSQAANPTRQGDTGLRGLAQEISRNLP